MRHEPATGSRAMPNQFTYYRWRKEFGGLKSDLVTRLKELEKGATVTGASRRSFERAAGRRT